MLASNVSLPPAKLPLERMVMAPKPAGPVWLVCAPVQSIV